MSKIPVHGWRPLTGKLVWLAARFLLCLACTGWLLAVMLSGATGGAENYWEYPTSTDAEPYSDEPPGSDAPDPTNTGNFPKSDGVADGYNDGFANSDGITL